MGKNYLPPCVLIIGLPVLVMAISEMWDRSEEQLILLLGWAEAQSLATPNVQGFCIMMVMMRCSVGSDSR
jgi:hypothetical protein